MNGQPAATVTPAEIIQQWNAVLPGFDHTHHQIGNFLIDVTGETAHASCYGTATHYLEHEQGSLWTVVGTYDFELKNVNNQWVITTMKFNYSYQSGNAELVKLAIANQK